MAPAVSRPPPLPPVAPAAQQSPARTTRPAAKKPGAKLRMDRTVERSAAILLALVVTALFASLARPSRPAVPAEEAPARATPGPLALLVRLTRPPAPLGLAAPIEGKLDPGPLVGSDRADKVALALAALPAAENLGMVVRRKDDLAGNLLVPLGFAGGDSKTGLLLDPTGSGAGAPGKATFMGAEATGRRFLIIADRSGSMSGAKFERLVAEINATVKALKPGARFYVIFYDDTAVPFPGTRWLTGRRDAASLEAWMAGQDTGGTTNPLPAFQIAFTQVHPRPDAIFFMTDGLFAPEVAAMIPPLNSARRVVPIHTISFVDRSAEPWLRKIADDSKGTYRHVDLAPP
jgi:von Willebrand factor type A domain